MLPVAMVALVLVEHGPLVLGLILGTRGVAGSLSALVTDALVSKVRKSTAPAMSDLVQCAVMLGFAFGPDGAAWLLALAALGGVAGSVGEPASGSIMPLLVPGARLQEANALRTIAGRAMGITGPAAAGMPSVVMDARTVFLIVASSFALGSAVLLRVREEPPRCDGPPPQWAPTSGRGCARWSGAPRYRRSSPWPPCRPRPRWRPASLCYRSWSPIPTPNPSTA